MATYPCVPDSADSHDIYEVFDVDTAKPWQVLSHYFPDKVGGRPAWLSLKPLPSYENLQCGRCKKPCVFLLQKYAPTESLHRTIFLFICRDPACCQSNSSDNLIVLRSQLPFDNDFYARQPPDEDYFDMSIDYPRADKFVSLCVVCGCAGSKQCGRCHQVTYCSREHQREDWLSGHKSVCSSSVNAEIKQSLSVSGILFPEFILDIPDDGSTSSSHSDETDNVDGISNSAESNKYSAEELEQMAADSAKHEDSLFDEFKKSMKQHPKQVLRYQRGGSPLWVTDKNVQPADTNIPNCDKCGARRCFEFQVMPQLLNHLGVDEVGDSIDWATLVVYTCSTNCEAGGQYGREFLWKQDY